MKKKSKNDKSDGLRPKYNLCELFKDSVQGKYADRFQEGINLALLDSDVMETFPNDKAVNEALRLVIKLTKLTQNCHTLNTTRSTHHG